jgi:hypothetical protein
MSTLKDRGCLGWDATAAGWVPSLTKSISGPIEWPMEQWPDLYQFWVDPDLAGLKPFSKLLFKGFE